MMDRSHQTSDCYYHRNDSDKYYYTSITLQLTNNEAIRLIVAKIAKSQTPFYIVNEMKSIAININVTIMHMYDLFKKSLWRLVSLSLLIAIAA